MRQTQINVVNRACVSYLKFGAVTTLVGVVANNLDKREHLTLVDNLGTTSLIVPSIRSLKAWRNEKSS